MIRIRQVKLGIEENNFSHLKLKVAKILNINQECIEEILINKKSIDARDKNKILFVYEVDAKIKNEDKILKKVLNKENITLTPNEEYHYLKIKQEKIKPVVVGFGPAGLFATLTLVEAGFKPIVIERGQKIEERVKTVNEFWEKNILNEECNVQFGEGGAGTFSDGKLNTQIKDKDHLIKHILKTLVQFGAPEEIIYENKPHIGTDLLQKVVKNIREYVLSKGAMIRYNTKLTDILIQDNKIMGIEVNDKKIINCDALILAIGHSARDTFRLLEEKGLSLEPKPFAVGLRISHSQELINSSQYGDKYNDLLGPASYKLTYQASNGHGVYSFCMCPGGYVVNASSRKERLVVNGMSDYKRDSGVANSAIIVTVNDKTYGSKLFSGMEFQEELERKAYKLGNGFIPLQLVKDYFNNVVSKGFNNLQPAIKGKYQFANLNELFPDEINLALKEAILDFNHKIKGFKSDDAILMGVETRSSSPIRILRSETMESNIFGIYPCGEGSGYAGGITTSAIDGVKAANAIIEKNNLLN